MRGLAVVLFIALAAVCLVVMIAALALWLRAVVRSRDGDTDPRLGEPSPVDGRTVPFMVLAGAALLAVRFLRGGSVPLVDAVLSAGLAALFLGFAVSGAWYLLARRSAASGAAVRPVGTPVRVVSGAVAVCFGVLAGLASP